MAYGYIDFGTAGDLSAEQLTGVFSGLTLDYINTADIYVVRTTTAGVQTTLTSDQFTVTTSPTLTVTVKNAAAGGIDLAASDLVRIGRTTSIDALTRTFTDGSVLKADDINTQNKQLLFATQENIDGGVGSLPIDTDGKYDAGGKIIKSLGSGNDANDAVSRGYVDGLTLYGTGTTTPQSWTHTTAAGDVSGTDRAWTLTSPTPNSTNDEMYLVEVGGVLQTPSDYDITEVGGTYTITLLQASSTGSAPIADGVAVIVRNFGVSRHVFKQPLKPDSASNVALTVQRLTSDAGHSNLQEWVDEAGTPNVLASVDREGSAVFKNLSLTGVISATGGDLLTIRQVVPFTDNNHENGSLASGTTLSTRNGVGLYVSIQPKSASSKLLFIGRVGWWNNTGPQRSHLWLYKDATNSGVNDAILTGGSDVAGSKHHGDAVNFGMVTMFHLLDSPGTGTYTYDLAVGSGNSGWERYDQFDGGASDNDDITRMWCIELG